MLSIIQLTGVLQGVVSKTKIKPLAGFMQSFYCAAYATTTRSLSRYSLYSRRNLFGFLTEDYEWIRILLGKGFIFKEGKHFIAAIDELVAAKSGKLSFGLSRFYSSLAGNPLPVLVFLLYR